LDLEELSEKITDSIEGLSEYIQKMEEFVRFLALEYFIFEGHSFGKQRRYTNYARTNVQMIIFNFEHNRKEEISDGNDEIKSILELFKQFDRLTLKRKDDIV